MPRDCREERKCVGKSRDLKSGLIWVAGRGNAVRCGASKPSSSHVQLSTTGEGWPERDRPAEGSFLSTGIGGVDLR